MDPSSEFYKYLQNEIGLSKEALDLGIRQANNEKAPLPIILWNFGLISLQQYQDIINWKYTK